MTKQTTDTKSPAKRTTKIDKVIALLKRPQGATLDEMVKATGWLPHTTRAALTGLKKKGHAIQRDTSDIAVQLGARPKSNAPRHLTLTINAHLRRSGKALRLVEDSGRPVGASEPQQHLVRVNPGLKRTGLRNLPCVPKARSSSPML